jgi:hypothetical protein
MSTWLFLAILLVCLAGAMKWPGQAAVRAGALVAIGAGLAASICFLALDLTATHKTRQEDQLGRAETATLPDRALVYSGRQSITSWALEPGRYAALPISPYPTFDFALIDRVLSEGGMVLVNSAFDTRELRAHYGKRVVPTRYMGSGAAYLQVLPAPASR